MKLVQANKKQEKYKDTEPTAIDLFKEMHCSKKSGFCEPVQNATVSIFSLFYNTYLKVNLNIVSSS